MKYLPFPRGLCAAALLLCLAACGGGSDAGPMAAARGVSPQAAAQLPQDANVNPNDNQAGLRCAP